MGVTRWGAGKGQHHTVGKRGRQGQPCLERLHSGSCTLGRVCCRGLAVEFHQSPPPAWGGGWVSQVWPSQAVPPRCQPELGLGAGLVPAGRLALAEAPAVVRSGGGGGGGGGHRGGGGRLLLLHLRLNQSRDKEGEGQRAFSGCCCQGARTPEGAQRAAARRCPQQAGAPARARPWWWRRGRRGHPWRPAPAPSPVWEGARRDARVRPGLWVCCA